MATATAILWRDTGGDTRICKLLSWGSIKSTYALGTIPTIWSIAGTGDFNGDGTTDILWHDAYGDVTIWMMNAGSIAQGISVGNLPTSGRSSTQTISTATALLTSCGATLQATC